MLVPAIGGLISGVLPPAGPAGRCKVELAVEVNCHAGCRGEEAPRRFFVGARAVDVVDVLDRWLSAELRYFKLAGDDGGTYILRHDVAAARWELTLFDSGRVSYAPLSSRPRLSGVE